MKLTISREELIKPLQMVTGVVEKRQTLPILSNILLQVADNQLTLTGTDLEVEMKADFNLQGADEGEITLPARKFGDICRALPEGATINLVVDTDKATVRSGKSRFTLATLPATEFPSTDSIASTFEFSLAQAQLKKLIDKTQFCMANQDVRYYLNGLLLEIGNHELKTVATDGHRLAVCSIETDIVPGELMQVIIPRKCVTELSRLLNDSDEACEIQLSTNFIRFSFGHLVITSKLIDGRFPDYERVIPPAGSNIIQSSREELRNTLVRTSILSNEKYRGVRLNFHDSLLKATVNNPEQEEAEEELAINYEGDELEIGFNVSYLLDALNVISEEDVRIELNDSNSSCVISGIGDDSSRYIVMPMRL